MSFGIWNSIDELGLYLGIDRLPKESDDSFRQRLYQVSRFLYKPDHYSQVKSIAAQCGLEVKPVIQIDSDKDFICKLDHEYFSLETDTSFLRIFIGRDDILMSSIIEGLENIPDLDIILYTPSVSAYPVKHIIKNTNIKIKQEFMPSNSFILDNQNIVRDSLEFEDTYNFLAEKEGLVDIKNNGDYFIDYKNGYINSKNLSEEGQIVKYKYIEKPFILEYSEIAITPLNQIYKYGIHNKNIVHIPLLLNNLTYSR